MGKASRSKRAGTARERIAAQRAAERRAETRNRVMLAAGAVIVVIAIVVAFVLVKINSKPPKVSNAAVGTALTASVARDLTHVPASALNAVGVGTANPKAIITIPGTHLTSHGKPEVLYIGAEYCPFCATERWAIAVAMSRFGTFSGLHGIHSSPTDQPASVPTLTFYTSSYTSNYIDFIPVEYEKINHQPLQKLTSAQEALLTKYDGPPYLPPADGRGSIPFIDFGNQYMLSGASYQPSVLLGKTWSQIAAALHDPSSPIAQGALGTANEITAAICKLTGNRPASACTPVVKHLEKNL